MAPAECKTWSLKRLKKSEEKLQHLIIAYIPAEDNSENIPENQWSHIFKASIAVFLVHMLKRLFQTEIH